MPRILLTNDDGFDAPGIAALAVAAGEFGPLRMVAPLGPQSGCSHKVTTHEPIPIIDLGSGNFAVDAAPADCVRLAIHHLTGPIDWIISGINAGGNLGVDVHHSGTVAAVREGEILGVRGVAISHYIAKGRAIDWDRAARWAGRVLRVLIDRPTPPEAFWNVNLPHPGPEFDEPEIVFCPVDPSPHHIAYRVGPESAEYSGVYTMRPRRPGWDIDVCLNGAISVSLIDLIGNVGGYSPVGPSL